MVKEYRYRKHIRYLQYLLPRLLIVLILCFWIFAAIMWAKSSVKNPTDLAEMLTCGGILTIILGLESVFIWFFLRRFSKVCVFLNGGFITYRNVKGEQKIAIDSITALEFASVKYTGGWIKIIAKNDTIRLTVVIEEIGDLLRKLKAALDSRGKNDVYSPKKFYSFIKTAEYSDQSWERAYSIFWKLCAFVVLNIAIGLGFAWLSGLGALGWIVWIAASIIGPTLVYCIGDLLIARKISKESDEETFTCPPRDKVFEKSIYTKSGTIYSAVYLLLSIIVLVVAHH